MKKKSDSISLTASRFSAIIGIDRNELLTRLAEQKAVATGRKNGGDEFSLADLFHAAIGGDIAEQRLRKVRAEADTLEHKLAIQKGEYMPVKECVNIVLNCGWSIRRVILALPIPDREKDSLLGDLQKLSAEWAEKGDALAAKIEETGEAE